jgi:hypothetical protein
MFGCGGIEHHPRHPGAHDIVLGGDDRRGARPAVQKEHAVLLDQLLDRRDHVVGVAAVVLQDDLDLATVDPAFLVDLVVVHPGGVHHVESVGHRSAGERAEHSDPDRRRREPGLVRPGRGRKARECRHGERNPAKAVHGHRFLPVCCMVMSLFVLLDGSYCQLRTYCIR